MRAVKSETDKSSAKSGKTPAPPEPATDPAPIVVSKDDYEKELARLQTELVRMQEWIVHEGLRVMVHLRGS